MEYFRVLTKLSLVLPSAQTVIEASYTVGGNVYVSQNVGLGFL